MAMSVLAAFLGLHGKKPTMPGFDKIDATQEQRKALQGNLSNFDLVSDLAAKVNRLNEDEILKLWDEVLPGSKMLKDRAGELVADELGGRIPESDIDVERLANAGWGIESGAGYGSGMGRARLGRNLGLRTYDIQRKGLADLDSLLGFTKQNFMAPIYDPSQMLVDPTEQLMHSTSERDKQFNVDWMGNKLDAMPSPKQQALAGLLDWVAEMGKSATSMALGGAMGGGGAGLTQMMGGGGGGGGSSGSYVPQWNNIGAGATLRDPMFG